MITKPYVVDSEDGFDEYAANLWLGLGDVRDLKIDNVMMRKEWEDASLIPKLIVDLCLDPAYLHFFIKYILNINAIPFQGVMLDALWTKKFPMIIASRGASKSFTIAVYLICRAVLQQGCSIAVTGAGLRQSMVIFNYIEQIWKNAPLLRDICGGENKRPKKELHMASWSCGNSRIIFLPIGDGSTIRGQRANVVVCDEFASIPGEIFETVIRGFASTKSGNIFDSVVSAGKSRAMRERGIQAKEVEKEYRIPNVLSGNQIIISGTASFEFNHFCKYFNYYRSIIRSGGDRGILKKEFPDMIVPENLDVRDYAVFRLPYDEVHEGVMDDNMIASARATMDPIVFAMEYGCVFPSDSDGFFKASYIENATCPLTHNGEKIFFGANRVGNMQKRCVMGIDPASEDDNFAICIVEINDARRHYVYQWSTNRKRFEDMKRKGFIDDDIQDYHTFCIKHVRDLCRRFNISLIVLDAGGGGIHVREGLRDPDKMEKGELPILDMDDPSNYQDKGHRILKMVEFSSTEWRKTAHYNLRKDLIDKILLFPAYDEVEVALAGADRGGDDKAIAFDDMEDCYSEILECKTEMMMVKHSQTSTGVERWEVPQIRTKSADGAETKIKKLKKDRFTSLLLANWGCRVIDEKGYSVDSSVYNAVKRGQGSRTFNSGVAKAPPTRQLSGGRRIYTGL